MQRPHAWLVIVLVFVAASLRLHALDRLPPGLHHDEAYYALDAQRMLRGHTPLFFNGNGGREPLHMVLLAGGLVLWGERPWTVRMVAVFSSLLAIPLVYRLGSDLFKEHGARAGWIGALAAAALAVSYWHVSLSRLGFRAVHLVPLSTLALWLLWRAWRRPSLARYAWAGAVLGLNLYTYLAARFLPLVVGGFLLANIALMWKRHGWKAMLRARVTQGSLILGLAALLAFAPLGAYFLQQPQAFAQRTQIAALPDTSTLIENIGRVARMFIDQGDVNLRHNLPGRPALDPWWAAGLALGLAAALYARRPHVALLAWWWLVMLLPTALSTGAPNSLRAIGALPPTALLAGAGLAWAWEKIVGARKARAFSTFVRGDGGTQWGRMQATATGWALLVIALTAASGGLTVYDYFIHWANTPALGEAFDAAQYRLAERALASSREYDVVMPLEMYHYPTTLFFLEPVFQEARPWTPASGERPVAIISPAQIEWRWPLVVQRHADGSASHSIVPPLSPELRIQLEQPPVEEIRTQAGEHVASIHLLPAAAFGEAPVIQPLNAAFGPSLQLSGYTLERAAQRARLTLFWRCTGWVEWDYSLFIHLRSALGEPIEQRDRHPLDGALMTTLWSPGQVIPLTEEFELPETLPPGKYRFEVGLYNLVDHQRVPATLAGQTREVVPVGLFTVPEAALDLSQMQPLDIIGGEPPTIAALGYALDPAAPAPGGQITVTLYWRALRAPERDYTVFIHLLDPAGELRAQIDAQPLQGRAPTSLWLPGETFQDRYTLALGVDLPPGAYSLALGLYDWATGERLPLTDSRGAPLPDNRVLIYNALQITP